MECCNNNYINNVPSELHPEMFASSDGKSLVALSQTSKYFNTLVDKTTALTIPVLDVLAKKDVGKAIQRAKKIEQKFQAAQELIKIIKYRLDHIYDDNAKNQFNLAITLSESTINSTSDPIEKEKALKDLDSLKSKVAIRYTVEDVDGLFKVAESLVNDIQDQKLKEQFSMEMMFQKMTIMHLKSNDIINAINNTIKIMSTQV